ncbi:hypothetical protein LCGC14_1580580 [marine sediment metagenome]|uniref:Uncharacterized protein n=1 Tax=marine sediment metagenome TaxID=412755 RepID=A0A0F9J346_9ZZZZ
MVTRTTSYKLRASTPQPSKGDCTTLEEPAPATISFILQTFMAEKQITDSCEDKTELLCSNDMTGLGGNYRSASYSAQKFLDPDTNEIVFQATETLREDFIEEDEVPGVTNL